MKPVAIIFGILLGAFSGYLFIWVFLTLLSKDINNGITASISLSVGAGISICAFRKYRQRTYFIFALNLMVFFGSYLLSWYLKYSPNFQNG